LEPKRKLFGIGIAIGVAINIGMRYCEEPMSLRIEIIPDRDIDTDPDADTDPEGCVISPRCAGPAKGGVSRFSLL
jgi:hypothetical protein